MNDPEITCNYCGLTVYFNGTVPDMCLHCRDKFAMAALTGMFASGTWLASGAPDCGLDKLCEACYLAADVMLRVRKGAASTAPATPKESR